MVISSDHSTIGVLGAGVRGLSAAVCLAHIGHRTILIDSDVDRINHLQLGSSPDRPDHLHHAVSRARQSGRLLFTTDPAALADADAVFFCLPSPEPIVGRPDRLIVSEASTQIMGHTHGDTVVVVSSGSLPETTKLLQATLDRELIDYDDFFARDSTPRCSSATRGSAAASG